MKTFKQFMENVTPKMYDSKDTKAPFNAIRTPDVIMKSAEKFRKGTGFNLPIPIVKKKTTVKTV
jgi:hypothetical protein